MQGISIIRKMSRRKGVEIKAGKPPEWLYFAVGE
jgi:hypothetical protein